MKEEENLKKIQLFFKYNLEIKNLFVKMAFNEEFKYNNYYIEEYSDKLYFGIKDMEELFLLMCDCLNNENIKIFIREFFTKIQTELVSCGYNYNKLKSFYEKNISTMHEKLLNKVKKEFVGFSLFGESLEEVLKSATSTNELLHVLHCYVVNSDYIYRMLPLVKENEEYEVQVFGSEWKLASEIADNFEVDAYACPTQIISLPNMHKLIIMVRDKGHALTIELDVGDKKSIIHYFIPKICNPLIVNKLKGVRKVPVILDEEGKSINRDVTFTSGICELDTENLVNELIDFIKSCPTDEDMNKYGGWFYSPEKDENRKSSR